MHKTLHLTLLGSPRLRLGDQPLTGFSTNKAQALLFYLAVTGQPHSRDHLATLLWDEMTDTQAKKNLRTVLPDLRRLLGDHLLLDRQTVAFQPTFSYWLDVEVLRRDLTPGQVSANLEARQAAVELYQGEFLSGFYVHNAPVFDAWVLEQRELVHALVVNALALLVEEHIQAAEYGAALSANRRLLMLEPWSEPVHRQQMLLLAQTGERSAALAQYEVCQRILAAEFGIEPLAETTALYEQIRAGASSRQEEAITPSPPPAQRSKFKNQNQAEQTDAELRMQASGLPIQVTGHNLPPRTKLYGRQPELARLQKWVAEDGCQLVGIFGIGGQGKTALAAMFAHTLAEAPPPPNLPLAGGGTDSSSSRLRLPPLGGEGWGGVGFTRILWQSLLNAPPLAEVMQEWFYVLSDQTVTSLPTSLDQQFSQLLGYLGRQRCLLVLDNLESILQGEGRGGYYRPGYEAYGQLFRGLVEGDHQSCLLLTSRERPQDFTHLEEDTPTVRFLALAGLPIDAGQAKLQARGVVGAPADLAALVQQYSGNPLALKLVAETVQSLFAGDIPAFLQAQTLVFDDIRDVLDQQFARLTPLERELMVWLAIVREPVSYTTLCDLLAQPPAARLVLEALRSLQRRLLLEQDADGFGLQNVVMEYTTDWLVDGIYTELVNPDQGLSSGLPLPLLNRYALILAQTKDYVRESQTRQLLQPVTERLLAQLGVRGAEQQVQRLLARLRTAPPTPGYAAANLLHVLLQLGVDLRRYDFSQLFFRQLYLRGISLPQTTFAQAELIDSVFTERLGRVFTVAFSPDGRWLAAGTREGAIHLWRTADQQLAQVIWAHNDAIIELAFTQPSGEGTSLWLASAGSDHAVGLWRLDEQAQHHWHGQLLHGHQRRVIGVGFSPDGQRLASVDLAGVVLLWDMRAMRASAAGRREPSQRFSVHPPRFRAFALNPDGQTLAIGATDGLVRLWHTASGTPGLVLAGHTAAVTVLAFSPDGQMLASGSTDGRLCLWALPQGQLHWSLDAAPGRVYALAVSPDGQMLASSHLDHAVRLWALDTGRLRHTLVGHTGVVWSVAFHPRPGMRPGVRQSLASGGSDQVVRLWDAQTSQPHHTLRGHQHTLSAIALTRDGTQLASVGYDPVVHLWPWREAQASPAPRVLRGHRSLLHTVAFSPDGRTVASAGRDPAIHLWDAASEQLLHTLSGHTQAIYRVAFHPEGHLLASGSADGTVRLWDWRNGQPVGTVQANPNRIYTLAFSPDGRLLATAGSGPTICLWSIAQPQCPQLVTTFKTPDESREREILALAFSPDGTTLACGGLDQIQLWDLHSADCQVLLTKHGTWLLSLAFSPDGATLASSSEDHAVCLWNVAQRTERALLHGHREGVYSVIFSADGAYVLSSSADGTIKVWNSQTGECVNTLFVAGPYARMNITGITGVTKAQKAALKALGAVEA